MTQFARVLSKLKIEIMGTNPSHFKGRVERANKTPQARFILALRCSPFVF